LNKGDTGGVTLFYFLPEVSSIHYPDETSVHACQDSITFIKIQPLTGLSLPKTDFLLTFV